MNKQTILSSQQLEAFYHDDFVSDQVNHFLEFFSQSKFDHDYIVVDLGGGCGFFGTALMQRTNNCKVRVIDMDPVSIDVCRKKNLAATIGDALNPVIIGDEYIVCFNLILHHLIGHSEIITTELQKRALASWKNQVHGVFVNEYIYDSYFMNISAKLIYVITKSKWLSLVVSIASKLIPSLHANTFGIGVRFRSHSEWVSLFKASGYDIKSHIKGRNESIPIPLRLLLISSVRRDSYLLTPITNP